MGSFGGLMGTAGGAGGTGFANPQLANITNPVTQEQADQAYSGVQGSIGAQSALLNALQNQNGLGNQSQVYGQLQGVANGTGPNPAQAMLSQATGQNVANQAALMAGQRGASANVGLMAQLAAQQGANTQQQAVGQGATMQANQSLGAIGQAGEMANQQAANQIGQTNANTGAQQAEQGNLLNAINGYNTNQTSSQNSVNAANAGMSQTMMQGQQALIGGGMNSGAVLAGAAQGGMVEKFAGGGMAGPQSSFGQFLATVGIGSAPTDSAIQTTAPNHAIQDGAAALTKALAKQNQPIAQGSAGELPGAGLVTADAPPQGTMTMPASNAFEAPMAARGGMVPAMVSPGERFLKPQDVKKVAEGKADPLKSGEKIPGKPKYPGNDYRNDVVPKNLESGGVVIPNAVLQSKNPGHEAKKFVEAVMQKRKMRG